VRLSDQTLCDLKGIGSGGSLRVRYSHPQAELFMMCRPASSMVFGRVPEVVSATGRSEVRVGVLSTRARISSNINATQRELHARILSFTSAPSYFRSTMSIPMRRRFGACQRMNLLLLWVAGRPRASVLPPASLVVTSSPSPSPSSSEVLGALEREKGVAN